MKKYLLLVGLFGTIFPLSGCQDKRISNTQTLQSGHQVKPWIKHKWHWDEENKQNESAGYAQVVEAGNTIYISGVPTADLSAKGIGNVYKSLQRCLQAFGATSKNVVKETLYTTDIETMKKYNDVRKAFYHGDFPAATWMQVSRLYEPDSKLEIELIAQLPDEE